MSSLYTALTMVSDGAKIAYSTSNALQWDGRPICIGPRSNGGPMPWGYSLQYTEHRMPNPTARAPPHETPTYVPSKDCSYW
jgi:hypothetical protein